MIGTGLMSAGRVGIADGSAGFGCDETSRSPVLGASPTTARAVGPTASDITTGVLLSAVFTVGSAAATPDIVTDAVLSRGFANANRCAFSNGTGAVTCRAITTRAPRCVR